MIKSTIYLLPILLLPLFSIGQNSFDYSISKPYPVVNGGKKLYFSDIFKEKALSIKIDGKDVYLQIFDAKSMKELNRKKYTDLPEDFEFEHATRLGNRLYFFYSNQNRKEKFKTLSAREIDFDKCQFMHAGKEILTVHGKQGVISWAMFGRTLFEPTGNFTFNLSLDKTKLLVQYRKAPEVKVEKQNYDVIGMYVFDHDLKKVKGNEIKMPYTEKKMDNVDYTVDSEGTPYMLAKVYNDGSGKDSRGTGSKRQANYFMELFKVDVDNKSIQTTKIEVTNNFIKDCWIYEGGENTIFCAGFYNKMVGGRAITGENRDENADGLFLFRIDKSGNTLDKHFYEIPLEILNQYTKAGAKNRNERKDKNDKAEFDYLELMELSVQKDSSIIVIGEQRYWESHTSPDRLTSTTTAYYNDILITKIDAGGKLVWMKKLPKRQAGTTTARSLGFKRLTIGGIHYLLFLDNDKNIKLGLNERPAKHIEGLGGFLMAYCVNDQSGDVKKVMIFEIAKLKGGMEVFQFGINRIVEISDSEFISEFYKKNKEDVMIKVKVK